MGLRDRLKSIFNRGSEQSGSKTDMPPKANLQNKSNDSFKYFTRKDGTQIGIGPVLDSMGNQTYMQVLNARTGQMKCIPKFSIITPELRGIVNSDFCQVYMDIDPKMLEDPYYSKYIANEMLGAQRMSKVIKQYKGYVGGMSLDQNGNITQRYIEQGIVEGLDLSQKEQWEQYRQRIAQADEERNAEALKRASEHGVHYKTSYAEDLSIEQ